MSNGEPGVAFKTGTSQPNMEEVRRIRSQFENLNLLRGNHPSDPRHFPFLISTPHNSAVPTVTTGLPVAGPSFKITLSPSM